MQTSSIATKVRHLFGLCKGFEGKVCKVSAKKQVYLFICRNLVPTRAESSLFGLCRVTPRFNKVSRSHFYAKRSEMKVVYNSYAPKPYCNLFSHGKLGSAGLDGLYKEVTEQIGNLFHEKDRISDYICNFVSDIKVLYSELYLIIKILS